MLHCQELGGVSEREAYKSWNMGQGMVLISPTPDDVIAVAQSHDIEARVIGKIVPKNAGIEIHTRGFSPDRVTF